MPRGRPRAGILELGPDGPGGCPSGAGRGPSRALARPASLRGQRGVPGVRHPRALPEDHLQGPGHCAATGCGHGTLLGSEPLTVRRAKGESLHWEHAVPALRRPGPPGPHLRPPDPLRRPGRQPPVGRRPPGPPPAGGAGLRGPGGSAVRRPAAAGPELFFGAACSCSLKEPGPGPGRGRGRLARRRDPRACWTSAPGGPLARTRPGAPGDALQPGRAALHRQPGTGGGPAPGPGGGLPDAVGAGAGQRDALVRPRRRARAAASWWSPCPDCPPGAARPPWWRPWRGWRWCPFWERTPAFLAGWVNQGEGAGDPRHHGRCATAAAAAREKPDGDPGRASAGRRWRELFRAGPPWSVRCDYCGKVYAIGPGGPALGGGGGVTAEAGSDHRTGQAPGRPVQIWLSFRLVPFLGGLLPGPSPTPCGCATKASGPVEDLRCGGRAIHPGLLPPPPGDDAQGLSVPARQPPRGEPRGVAILSSDSKDGERSAATWRWFGIHAVRGTAGGTAAPRPW